MDNKIMKQEGFRLALHLLLRDALALSLLAFAGFMTLEGLIPGFVSGHLNLAKVLCGIALLFFAFKATSPAEDPEPSAAKASASQKTNTPSWFIVGLLLWSALLILNSLIKFPLYAIAIIFILTAIIGKLLYDEFF